MQEIDWDEVDDIVDELESMDGSLFYLLGYVDENKISEAYGNDMISIETAVAVLSVMDIEYGGGMLQTFADMNDFDIDDLTAPDDD